jgi:hypothetical protein
MKGDGRTTATNSFGQVTLYLTSMSSTFCILKVIMLPTGRLFGRISKKGPNKSRAAGQFCGRILADFEQKGPKRGRILTKLFPFSYPHSREAFKKKCHFATHKDKSSVFLKPKFLQKGKIIGGPNFFPQRPNFSSGLAEKFCNELALMRTRTFTVQSKKRA